MKDRVWETEHGEVQYVGTKGMLKEAVSCLQDSPQILLDTETTGLGPDRELRLAQFGVPSDDPDLMVAYVVDPKQFPKVITKLSEYTGQFVAHNAPFDLLTLSKYVDPSIPHLWALEVALADGSYCTNVAHQVYNSTPDLMRLGRWASDLGVHNDYEQALMEKGASIGLTKPQVFKQISITDKAYLQYAGWDIFQLNAVYHAVKKMHRGEADELLKVENKIHMLYSILRDKGVSVDLSRAEKEYDKLNKAYDSLLKLLNKGGIDKVSSSQQVSKALAKHGFDVPMTSKGNPSCSSKVLSQIKPDTKAGKIAKVVLKAKSLQKDLATIKNIAGSVENGKVHPELRSIGTVTLRSSCNSPNLQQMNKRAGYGGIRSLFYAEKGYVLGSCDYKNMELRVLANLTRDDVLADVLAKGTDVHGALAERIYGKDYTSTERAYCKNAVFAMVFGGGISAMARQAKCSEAEAQAIRDGWHKSYPTAHTITQRWNKNTDKRKGVVHTKMGWRPHVGRYDGKIASYRATNYHIQGYAAYVLKKAAIQLATHGYWPYVLMVIHDEFLLTLPDDDSEAYLEEIISHATIKGELVDYELEGEVYGRRWLPK